MIWPKLMYRPLSISKNQKEKKVTRPFSYLGNSGNFWTQVILPLLSDFVTKMTTFDVISSILYGPYAMTQSLWPLSGTSIQILFCILEDGPIWPSEPVYQTDFSVKYWPIAKTSSQYWNYNFEIKLGETNGSIKIQFCELYAVPNLGVTKFY